MNDLVAVGFVTGSGFFGDDGAVGGEGVLACVLCDAGLALGGLGPVDLRALRRLAAILR